MRPLRPNAALVERTRLVEHRGPLEARLIDAYGSWCSICERAILDDAWAWDIASRATVPRSAAALDQCADLLVLCRNCQDAQARTSNERSQELAVPVAYPTFSLGYQLFRYELVQTELPFVDPDRGFTELQPVSVVWVLSDDPRGQATIDRFGLNSNRADGQVALDPELRDLRLLLRTRTWMTATRAAESLESPFERWAVQALQIIRDTGFLSVWLTVLRSRRGADWAAQWVTQPAARELFRGTDWEALGGPTGTPVPLA